jgi:DNA repair protein RecO (recombination protein O)
MNGNLCIVLKAVNYRDYDKMLTLFSRKEGKVPAMAPGVRSVKSKLAAAAQPLCCAEYEFDLRKGKRYVKNVLVKQTFSKIIGDYDRFTAASVMIEMTEKILEHSGEWDGLFLRLIMTLDAMEKGEADAKTALAYFFVQAIDFLGIFPALDFCAACGKPVEAVQHFNLAEGGAVCADCAGRLGAPEENKVAAGYFGILRRVKPSAAAKYVGGGYMAEFISMANGYIAQSGDIRLRSMKFIKE